MRVIPYYFGSIAVSEGYIPENSLKECLETQKLYRQPRLIGEIMKEKGLLSEEQVMRILKMQQIYRTRLENEYFAHVAIKSKLLSLVQVRELKKKYEAEALEGRYLNLATLAVTNDYVATDKVESVIKSPEYQHFLKLKKQNKSVIRGYELVGNITKLKRTTIFKAVQVELERLVAVKILGKEFENEDYIKRFFYEAKITARFNHPNLVRIYDKGIDNNMYYYAMELVEGENLALRLGSEGRLQLGESLKLIRQIAKALQHIHEYKKLHTELNPRNIVIRTDGVAKLLDLSSSCSIKSKSRGKLSKMPQYIAPEQLTTTEELDVRTDIYGLGATFYRMLTGQPPVSGKKIDEIKKNIVEQEPKPITEIDFTIPEDVAKIVHRMIRKNPKKRYREIKNVLFALKKILI